MSFISHAQGHANKLTWERLPFNSIPYNADKMYQNLTYCCSFQANNKKSIKKARIHYHNTDDVDVWAFSTGWQLVFSNDFSYLKLTIIRTQ